MRGKERFASALLIGMLAFGACKSVDSGKQPDMTPPSPAITKTFTPEITPVEKQTYDQIIVNEVSRLEIKLSDEERLLWKIFGYNRSSEKVAINETTLQEAKKRIETVYMLMHQSENPYFRNAVNLMDSLFASGNLDISMSENVSSDIVTAKPAMGIAIRTKEGKINYLLAITPNEVLNNSSAVTLAIQLVHEAKHIEDSVTFQNSLPQSMPLTEKISRDNERLEDSISYLQEEAQGFGAQALAYIYERGLGYTGAIGLSHEKMAVKFIKFGSDVNNPLWQKYLADEVLFVKK